MKTSCACAGNAGFARRKARAAARHRQCCAALLASALLLVSMAGRADEPYARSRDYNLQHARIALRFNLEQRKVIGEVTHTLTAVRDGVAQLAFDSVGLTILSVTVNSRPAKFETTAAQLLIALDHPIKIGERFEIEIRYEGRPKKGLYFVLPDKNYPDRPRQVWTQGEAEDTRYYIPIYDYPNDRTSTEMIVTVPREWLTISNGKLVEVADAASGMKTWHWRQSLPHSTYLISLVAGEYEVTKETWRNIPVAYYVPRGRADRARPTFAHTRQMLDFFSNTLGVPYPWDQYAQTAVDDFVVGGMENTSATTLTTTGLEHPQVAHEFLEGSDSLVSHEMAHQWFGDLVTCKDWGNLWLNEGFATFFATLWEEYEYGADEAAYSRWRSRNMWVNSQRLYPVPIVTRSFTDATAYAGNIYNKASWVLQMLREQLGDDAFFRGLHHYLESNRGQNVVSADLAKAIEEATATNVDRFFDQWIYGAGAPRFEVHSTYEAASRQVKVEVKQTQTVEGRVDLFSVPVEIEITTSTGRKSYPVVVAQANQTFNFTAVEPPRMVLFDKGNKILKSVDFAKSPQEWIYQLQNADAVPDRLDAARALGDLKGGDEVVAALGQAARSDGFWGLRAEALRALGRIGGPAVQEHVFAALDDERPWLRQVAVEELAKFQGEASVAEKLKTIFEKDKAYRVRAAALASYAQAKPSSGLALLETAAAADSPDDRLRVAALRAMGTLGDDKAVPLLLNWSATGKPFPVRAAAITSLGHLARKNKEITRRLLVYLPENYGGVRVATIAALSERADPEAIPALEALLRSGELSEGQEKSARVAVDRLRARAGAGEKK
jgi:aminopeptidase N